MPSTRILKLYVWEDALTDYTSGIIIALAPDLRAARTAVRATYGPSRSETVERDLRRKPRVIRITESTPAQAWLAWGGG